MSERDAQDGTPIAGPCALPPELRSSLKDYAATTRREAETYRSVQDLAAAAFWEGLAETLERATVALDAARSEARSEIEERVRVLEEALTESRKAIWMLAWAQPDRQARITMAAAEAYSPSATLQTWDDPETGDRIVSAALQPPEQEP
jgi:hypothetical protein